MSREPSYYEIALTQRQVVIAFVILLSCLVLAFFSGVWVGTGAYGTAGAEPAAGDSAPGDSAGTDRIARTETGAVEPRASREPATPEEPGVEHLRFFTDEGGGGEPATAGEDELRPLPQLETGGATEIGETTPAAGEAGSRPAADPGSAEAAREPSSPPSADERQPPRQGRRDARAVSPVRPLPDAPVPVDPRDTVPGGDGPVIQVFSSRDQAQAQKLLDRLLRADLDAYLSPAQVRGVVTYRVRLGPFRDREQAEAVARQIRQDFKLETWITTP